MTLAGFAFIYYEKIIYNLKIKDEVTYLYMSSAVHIPYFKDL